MLKRIGLAYGCFYWKAELVPILIVFQVLHIAYLVHSKPYVNNLSVKKEIFTELTLLGLLYIL